MHIRPSPLHPSVTICATVQAPSIGTSKNRKGIVQLASLSLVNPLLTCYLPVSNPSVLEGAWAAQTAGAATNQWSSIAFGNGVFVAISYDGPSSGTNSVMTSPDGVIWTARTPAYSTYYWSLVTFGNGTFVATNAPPAPEVPRVMTSSDGISWSSYSVTRKFDCLTFGNGMFVGISDTDLTSSIVSTSSDGVTWHASAGMPVQSHLPLDLNHLRQHLVRRRQQRWLNQSHDISRWYYLDRPLCCTG